MNNTKSNIECFNLLESLNIKELNLTSLGNSISSGFAMEGDIKPLLERNETLKDVAKLFNIKVNTYNMARAQANNDNRVYGWILNNVTLQEMYDMNISDYFGASKMGCITGTANMEDYILKTENKGIRDILLENHPNLANIVIYHGATGSFLDNITRNGKHLVAGIPKDLANMRSILDYVQNQNREKNTNTQVYLGGAPNAYGLHITDVISLPIKNLSTKYACTSFLKPVYETAFRKHDGKFMYDIHYSKEEYDKLNSVIMDTITSNYIYKYALIQIDRELFKLSRKIEFEDANLKNDLSFMNLEIDRILEQQLKYLIRNNGDLKYFGKLLTKYFNEIYCYDFYYINKELTLNKIKQYTL